MANKLTRRQAIARTAAAVGTALTARVGWARKASDFTLASFSADVTCPLGHPCMGGGISPATSIVDPLWAHGLVIGGGARPVVFVAVDWCEIRNEAYARWQEVLAEAAGTDPAHVLVTSIHQHDAPVADLEAERILKERKLAGSICDIEFHERAVQGVAVKLRQSLAQPRTVTHLGIGRAKVERVASNRRYHTAGGELRFDRTSASRHEEAHAAEEGTIDPELKTISFWQQDRPLAAVSCYAVHPMSYYGQGGVSSDFVGRARQLRHADDPGVAQIYLSGCSGNVTAGKYNDGAVENRPILADRMYRAMSAAWRNTERHALSKVEFRAAPLELEPRSTAGFTVAELEQTLSPDSKPFAQCLAAMGLSWRRRVERGKRLDVPVVDLGPAQMLFLPGESYVEYQLLAQQTRPDSFVMTAGYAECAPGYIPIERAWQENDTNLRDWCWVAPGSEEKMHKAIQAALAGTTAG